VKLLVVIDSLKFGGAENVLVTLASEAPRLGMTMDVLVLNTPTDGRAEWLPRLRSAGLEPRFLGLTRLTQPNGIAKLARAIRASECDVVHAHLEDATTLAPIAGRLAHRPVLCTLHHVPGPLAGRKAVRERLAVMAGSRAAGLIMVSQASLDAFRARYPRSYRSSRWSVVHNGVDVRRFSPRTESDPPAAALAELGIPSGAPVIALVGHMRPGKGHEVAVRAWPEVLAGYPDARLVLIGDGPLEQDLRRLAREEGVDSRVVFAGARDDVQDLLPGATLALLPTQMEALPTALLEAAASGIATVATDVGGVPEVVVDGETGWLVARPDQDLIAGAVLKALGDPVELRRRGAAARARAERCFTSAAWADELYARYAAVASGGGAPR
jgi:glycosyltransferase involved in cell wall biosynthesis